MPQRNQGVRLVKAARGFLDHPRVYTASKRLNADESRQLNPPMQGHQLIRQFSTSGKATN
jgi:hypothetical protein